MLSTETYNHAIACVALHGATSGPIRMERIHRIRRCRAVPGKHGVRQRVLQVGPFRSAHRNAFAHQGASELAHPLITHDPRGLQ